MQGQTKIVWNTSFSLFPLSILLTPHPRLVAPQHCWLLGLQHASDCSWQPCGCFAALLAFRAVCAALLVQVPLLVFAFPHWLQRLAPSLVPDGFRQHPTFLGLTDFLDLRPSTCSSNFFTRASRCMNISSSTRMPSPATSFTSSVFIVREGTALPTLLPSPPSRLVFLPHHRWWCHPWAWRRFSLPWSPLTSWSSSAHPPWPCWPWHCPWSLPCGQPPRED